MMTTSRYDVLKYFNKACQRGWNLVSLPQGLENISSSRHLLRVVSSMFFSRLGHNRFRFTQQLKSLQYSYSGYSMIISLYAVKSNHNRSIPSKCCFCSEAMIGNRSCSGGIFPVQHLFRWASLNVCIDLRVYLI